MRSGTEQPAVGQSKNDQRSQCSGFAAPSGETCAAAGSPWGHTPHSRRSLIHGTQSGLDRADHRGSAKLNKNKERFLRKPFLVFLNVLLGTFPTGERFPGAAPRLGVPIKPGGGGAPIALLPKRSQKSFEIKAKCSCISIPTVVLYFSIPHSHGWLASAAAAVSQPDDGSGGQKLNFYWRNTQLCLASYP